MKFKLLSLAALFGMLSFTACKEVALVNPEDCADGIDNDGDNDIDCADVDCDAVAACQNPCDAQAIGGLVEEDRRTTARSKP